MTTQPTAAAGPALTGGRMVRGGAVLLASSVAMRLVGLAAAIVVARRLSVDEFGVFSFAVAYSMFLSPFADLGLDAITTRELAASPVEDEGRILGSALMLKSGVLVMVAAGGLAGLLAFAPGLRPAALISLATMLTGIPGTLSLRLTSRLRVTALSAVQLGGSVISLVAVILAIRAHAGVTSVIAVQTVASLVTGVMITVIALRGDPMRLTGDWSTVRALARDFAPLAVSALAIVIYRRIDQLLLVRLAGPAELARYASAVRLVDGLNIVPVAVATVALPALSQGRDTRRKEELASVGFRYLAAVILPIAALGTFAGHAALTAVFGPTYGSAASALTVLLWAHYFGFTGLLWNQVLISGRQSLALAALGVVAAVTNVAVNLWAIPAYGGLGAAIASLAAYAVPTLGGLMAPSTRPIFVSCLRASVRPAISAAIVLVVLFVLSPSLALVLPVFTVVTIATLVGTGAVPLHEVREALRRLTAGTPEPDPGLPSERAIAAVVPTESRLSP